MKKNGWGAFLHITINKINFHRDPQIIEHRCRRSRRRKDQASGCHHKDSISHLLPTKPDWNPRVFSRVLSSLPQKLAHQEKHLSVSPSGLNEHRPRNGSIKSGGYPVSLRNILAVKSSDFSILSYSTYLSDQLAVGLENHENFPVSAHTFLQITTVSRRQGVSSLATSGQKTLSRGNVYPFANQQSRWSRNTLHQPKGYNEGCTSLLLSPEKNCFLKLSHSSFATSLSSSRA